MSTTEDTRIISFVVKTDVLQRLIWRIEMITRISEHAVIVGTLKGVATHLRTILHGYLCKQLKRSLPEFRRITREGLLIMQMLSDGSVKEVSREHRQEHLNIDLLIQLRREEALAVCHRLTLMPQLSDICREPRIPLRYAENITARDVGRLINVYGMTSQAVIRPGENGSVRFVFDAENQASVSFFHRFRDQSIQQYDWISEIAASVNGDHGMLESLALACIGVCEKTNDGGYSLQVMEGDCISINDKSLSAFMRDWRI